MPDSSQQPILSGDLYELPFQAGAVGAHAAPIYAELVDEHGIDDVLVLKRFPTGVDSIRDRFAAEVDGVERPEIIGLSAHANGILSELPDPPSLLDGAERNLLLSTFVRDREWSNEHLARAAGYDSFEFDVARFVTEATWQGGRIDTEDSALVELATANNDFHEWLGKVDRLDPARSLRYAADALSDSEVLAKVQEPFDAVLVLEFEEFTAIDREYLARLTAGVPLVCIAEADSAIQRTWNEPRAIGTHAEELDRRGTLGESETPTEPGTIASFLATGETSGPRPTGDEVRVIETETFSDEIAAVGEEIERLHRSEGIAYDEMAVVLRDSNAPIPETLRGLQAAGVPATSATVGGLEHDPTARELYALASWCFRAGDPDPLNGETTDDLSGWERERAESTLRARIGLPADDLNAHLETIRDRAESHGLSDAIDYWLVASDLKHRIAGDEEPLDAKTQFAHVRTLRRLVDAIADSELLPSDWRTVCEGMETELQRATSDKIATELDLPDGGVLVDAVRVLKNEQRRVVFLMDIVDEEYPADPRFNSLFPTPHLEELEGYPAFTTPTAADVTETFRPAEDPTRPLHAYYAALSRRMLAVGARCATERLYFGLHREDGAGTGSRQQPSRFLALLEETFGEFERVDHEGVYSHGEAVRFAPNRVDDSLERVRRAGLVAEPIDIDGVTAEFEAVQRILDSDPPADLAPAIEARLDFAEGGVRRE